MNMSYQLFWFWQKMISLFCMASQPGVFITTGVRYENEMVQNTNNIFIHVMTNVHQNLEKLRVKSMTADLKLKNRFKLVPVPGLSCFPLAKQDSKFWKDCIFQLFSIDSEIARLDSCS